jgi:putative transposase
MYRENLSIGEYYHVFNRGTRKQDVFIDDQDYTRFLFVILYFQSLLTFTNPAFYTHQYAKRGYFESGGNTREKISENRGVELVSFCLMPNHFHLLLREVSEGGIARYMQRVQNAYSKYFNARYSSSGHVFQGPYKMVHVIDNDQLLHLSAYIHRNPLELTATDGHRMSITDGLSYEWSSLQDYCSVNRWGQLISQDVILDQFKDTHGYAHFIRTHSSKSMHDAAL